MAAVALLHQMYAGLHRFLGLVGALHAHIVLFSLPDFLVDFPRHSVGGRIPHRMGQLGGWFFLIHFLKFETDGFLAGGRVHDRFPGLDRLFRDFSLRLIRFGGGLVRLADGLLQRRVSAFLVRKAQARLLSQTIPPASGRPSCSAVPHREPAPGDRRRGAGADGRRSAPPDSPAAPSGPPRR